MILDKTIKRNTPTATLIKNYVNKQSGKVTESRKEIQKRFDYLDWKNQQKIILAFLESGMSDRQWAYSKLLDFWDKSFEPRIQELWEQLHEEKCSWVIIRHFPVEYIANNMATFTGNRDYYFICLRLAQDKEFIIGKEKLLPTDYLAVLYHTGRNIKEGEAYDILFQIVYENIMRAFSMETPFLDRYANSNKGAVITPNDFHDVSLAIYYLREMDCSHVISQFAEWNESIRNNISNSPEHKALCRMDLTDYDYMEAAIYVAKKYAYLALDDGYKNRLDLDIDTILQSKKWFGESDLEKSEGNMTEAIAPKNSDTHILKKMMKTNPSIEKLIIAYGLRVVKSEMMN